MFYNFKTEYNFIKSYAKINDIVALAKEEKLPAIGICDYQTTMGINKFYHTCIKEGIKPICGVEYTINEQNYLFYAKNYQGIIRLNELTSNFLQTGKYNFKDYEQDLIIVLGRGSLVKELFKSTQKELISKIKTTFSSVFFGVYNNLNDPQNIKAYSIAKENDIETLLINSIRLLKKEDQDILITLNAIANKTTYLQEKKMRIKIKNETLNLNYQLSKQELLMMNKFVDLIEIEFPKKKLLPPKYPFVPEKITSKEYLAALSKTGLNKRLNTEVPNIYKTRLNYELKIINQMGYEDYFLIMWDIIKFSKKSNIYVGPGRGSAAGSLVAYSLGITELNPIENGLIFERFLNPERISMPDIDVDFEDIYRNDIVDYIIKRFGQDKVCKIATISRFHAKSTFRDVAKVWKIEPNLIELVAKQLDAKITFLDNVKSNPKIQSELIKNQQLKIVLDIVNKIEGLPRQTSIHAAGVIISQEPIVTYTTINYEHVALAEAYELEGFGLLKFDILALANLTFLHKIVDKINLIEVDFTLGKIPKNDPKVIKMLAQAKTIGIFQLESQGMRNALLQIKPTNFQDIANALSLYRPGPREYIGKYVENKNKFVVKNEIDEILKDSYGIIIYQEQIILIATKMAGYSLGQADILRRSISKKDSKTMNELAEGFIVGSIKNGYSKEVAQNTFTMIAKFANYGFNKAHAYCYATIAYQMAYLKLYYQNIFYAELFYYNFKSSKCNEFLLELDSQNIVLYPPNILKSDIEVSVEDDGIRMGLSLVNAIGKETAKLIIDNRQYINLNDSFEEIIIKIFKGIKISQNQINYLVDAGCFNDFEYNEATLKYNIYNFINGDVNLVRNLLGEEYTLSKRENPKFIILAENEKKALTINIRYKYFEKIKASFEKKTKLQLATIDDMINTYIPNSPAQITDVCMKIKACKEITTKKGDKMCFLTVESEQIHDVTVFNKIYEKSYQTINNNLDGYVVARIKIENGQLYLINI